MRLKIIRKDKPNEDGRWIEVPGDPPKTRSWRYTAQVLEQYVPEGYFLAQVETDIG